MLVATYNILHGYNEELILRNIRLLVKEGVDIICLQEADVLFENALNQLLGEPGLRGWQVEYAHAGIGGNLALLWNNARCELKGSRTILLPTIPMVLLQRLQGHRSLIQRAALSGIFLMSGKAVRITSVHLAWEGGVKHRLSQLAHLKAALEQDPIGTDVICGDFNTFAPSVFRRSQQYKVEQVLGKEYANALPELVWSCDISYTAPQDGWDSIAKICRFLGIKLRSRLDYIFARNLQVKHAGMLDLPGSDHRPLVADLRILS